MTTNVVANYVGRAWAAVLLIVLVPIYVRLLGIESYGLVGFLATLQTLVALLDCGLSTTLNRQMARYSTTVGAGQETRDFVRTVEVFSWSIACLVSGAIAGAAPWLAREWIRSESLSPGTVQRVVLCMGAIAACNLPTLLYTAGLQGQGRQVLTNALSGTFATIRGVGAIAVLIWVSSTITAFFVWLLAASVLQTIVMAVVLWRSLPAGSGISSFRPALLRRVRGFAAGMSGFFALSVATTHLDKVLLSTLLPLESFGYYMLAWTAAYGLLHLGTPIFNAAFPGMSATLARGDWTTLASQYHRASQWTSVVLIPATLVMVLFTPQILMVWTGNAETARQTTLLLRWFAVGVGLNGLLYPAYAVLLAHGSTRPILWPTLVCLLIQIALAFVLVPRMGAAGGAVAFVIGSAVCTVTTTLWMHRRLLPGHLRRWAIEDIVMPAAGACAIAVTARTVLPAEAGTLQIATGLVVVSGLALVGAASATSPIRSGILLGFGGKKA
jgi:O-antigen/teichoic acid export membrane protein